MVTEQISACNGTFYVSLLTLDPQNIPDSQLPEQPAACGEISWEQNLRAGETVSSRMRLQQTQGSCSNVCLCV